MLSDYNYTNNSESIFYDCILSLNDIFNVENNMYISYNKYLKSLSLFQKIIKRYDISNITDNENNMFVT